jgi:hypothetical protein
MNHAPAAKIVMMTSDYKSTNILGTAYNNAVEEKENNHIEHRRKICAGGFCIGNLCDQLVILALWLKTTTENKVESMIWTINDLDEYKNYLTNYYLDGITSDYYNYYDIP